MTATLLRPLLGQRKRRRTPAWQKASRTAMTVPGPALALAAWIWLRDDLARTGVRLPPFLWDGLRGLETWAGLGVMAVAGLALWPLLLIAVLFAPAARMALVPRRFRRQYRNRPDRWWWRNSGRAAARSQVISGFVRRVTWSADRFQCVVCRTLPVHERHDLDGDIAVDHWCPWILGGLTVLFNLVTLCRYHNTIKSYYWRDRSGYEHYHGHAGPAITAAREISAIERRARRSPLRWWRAAWALGG